MRNGCRVRVGKQACHHCRNKNAGPASRRAFFPRRERIPNCPASSSLLHVERDFSGGQRCAARRGGAVLRVSDTQWPRCAAAARDRRRKRTVTQLLEQNRIGSPLIAGLSDGECVETG